MQPKMAARAAFLYFTAALLLSSQSAAAQLLRFLMKPTLAGVPRCRLCPPFDQKKVSRAGAVER